MAVLSIVVVAYLTTMPQLPPDSKHACRRDTMKVCDGYVSELDERAARLEATLGLEHAKLLDDLVELHLARAREMARTALMAGMAMGRGLAVHFTGP